MPSPFPGMDPYLEANPRWMLFHAWFVRELARITLPKAQALDCWIDVERMVYQEEPNGEIALLGEPDEAVWSEAQSKGNGLDSCAIAVALAEPKVVHEVVLDPVKRFKQDYLVIRELDKEPRRILAVVEVLSPANKEGSYMQRYREKRSRFMASSAHFMEIDFLRTGDNPARRLFPELEPTPYFIFVARKKELGRNEEAYPIRLQDPLPIVGLPVGPPRPDLPLDLPAAFQAAYELSVPRRSMRYDQPPDPPLDPVDAAWADLWLRSKQVR